MTDCPSGVPEFPAPARLLGDDLPALGGMLVLYCGQAGVQFAPMSVVQPTRLVSPKRTCGQHGLMADMGGFATVCFRAEGLGKETLRADPSPSVGLNPFPR